MKVFISWSGQRSKHVAGALRDWLPMVIQSLQPWMSDKDIGAGQRWFDEIMRALESRDMRAGIVCLTPEALKAPWLHFEAGALAKTLKDKALVCPYLVECKAADIEGPLVSFNAVEASKAGTLKLLQTINGATGSPLDARVLDNTFELNWPSLETQLRELPPSNDAPIPKRSMDSILEEILSIVRSGHPTPTFLPSPAEVPVQDPDNINGRIVEFVLRMKETIEASGSPGFRVEPLPSGEWHIVVHQKSGSVASQLLPHAENDVVRYAVSDVERRLANSLRDHYEGGIEFVPRV